MKGVGLCWPGPAFVEIGWANQPPLLRRLDAGRGRLLYHHQPLAQIPCVTTSYLPYATALAMRSRIVSIGNSQGVRIPKPLLEQAGRAGDVELHAETGRIVIAASRVARAGWAVAAQRLHAAGEDALVGSPLPTRFDETEWEWR